MTDQASHPRRGDAIMHSPTLAWVGFALVHLWLAWVCLFVPHDGMGDVVGVYKNWAEQAVNSGIVVGIDTAWVYPIVGFVPMLAATALGPDNFGVTWVALMVLLNAVAFAFLVRPSRLRAAWWWLAYLLVLGPIALARIDAVTVALGIVSVTLLATRPRAAGVVLGIATWVKVWPAALVLAALVSLRSRARILLAGAVVSAAIVAVALLLGSGTRVFSFVTEQANRGLQIEAPVTTWWMWAAFAGQPGASVYFDKQIITYQVTGAGVDVAAAVMTPLLVVAVAVVTLLGVRAVRAGARSAQVLPSLSLALVVALIAFNKVGSPQFISWIAVPIVLGVATAGVSFRVPAVIALIVAGLTQVVYPYLYPLVLELHPVMLGVLTVRNALEFVLLGWAIRSLVVAAIPSRDVSSRITPSRDISSRIIPQ